MAHAPSSFGNATAFEGDSSIFDSSPSYSTTSMTDLVSAALSPKTSINDFSSKLVSSSASRSRVEKRKANTLAARRYRQNRLNMISELESALKETQQERDALKVQLARLQGENQILKDLVGKPPRGQDGEES
ncbi:hypothetical protein MMC26_001866 [Xylographa opegraphella]|nr:hypothetical protein [Xylographa opegraphella]